MGFLDSFFGKPQKVKTDFSGLATQAEQYTNPFSNLNQGVLSQLTNQSTDVIAQQGLNNQRMSAMGINPFANMQNNQLVSNVIKNAGGGWQDWLRNSQSIGTGLLTNKAQMEFQRDLANAQMKQAYSQNKSDFLQQLTGQLFGSSIPGALSGGTSNFLSGLFGG